MKTKTEYMEAKIAALIDGQKFIVRSLQHYTACFRAAKKLKKQITSRACLNGDGWEISLR